jgi:hypothetical protein
MPLRTRGGSAAYFTYPLGRGLGLLVKDREAQLPKHAVRLLTTPELLCGDAGGFAQNVLRWVDLVVVLQRVLVVPLVQPAVVLVRVRVYVQDFRLAASGWLMKVKSMEIEPYQSFLFT